MKTALVIRPPEDLKIGYAEKTRTSWNACAGQDGKKRRSVCRRSGSDCVRERRGTHEQAV